MAQPTGADRQQMIEQALQARSAMPTVVRDDWRERREQREGGRSIPVWSVSRSGGRLVIEKARFEGGRIATSGPAYDFEAWRRGEAKRDNAAARASEAWEPERKAGYEPLRRPASPTAWRLKFKRRD